MTWVGFWIIWSEKITSFSCQFYSSTFAICKEKLTLLAKIIKCYFLFIILVKIEFLRPYHLNTQYNTLLNTLNKKGSWVFELTDCHLPSGISRYFNLTDYNDQEVNIGDETRNLKIQCGHRQNNRVEIFK